MSVGCIQVHFMVGLIKCIILTGTFQHMVLADSIPKYVNAKYTKVSFHKGNKIQDLMDQIRFNKDINLTKCDLILIIVSTNDISHLVDSGLIKTVTVHDIMHKYEALSKVIHHCNRHATLIFSAILPRAHKFSLFFPLIFYLNFALEKWCAKFAGKHIFIHTPKLFLRGGASLNVSNFPNQTACT